MVTIECFFNLPAVQRRNFLAHIIMLDKTLVKLYKPELKLQSKNWHHYGSSQSLKFHQNLNIVKVMVVLVYVCDDVFLTYTFPPQQTDIAQYYLFIFGESHPTPALRKKNGDTFCRKPCMTMHGLMQHELWLICSNDGAEKCCTIYHIPQT